MAVVIFRPEEFRQDFPQFADPARYSDRRLQGAFRTAEGLLDNTDSSPVPYDPDRNVFLRETALYHLTCHVLTLADWAANGQSGPVASASEGSVSVSFAAPTADASDYQQTPCGKIAWSLTLPYRMGGRYAAMKPYHPWG